MEIKRGPVERVWHLVDKIRAFYRYAREDGQSRTRAVLGVIKRVNLSLNRRIKGKTSFVYMEGLRDVMENAPPLPPLPDGFTIRTYRPGDEVGMARVYAAAWLDAVTPQAVRRLIVDDPAFKPEQVFIIEKDNEIIATGQAYYYPDAPEIANGRMVGVLPKYRRLGVGTILALTMMNYHKVRGYQTIRYATHEWRDDALRRWIDLGFYPLLRDEADRERWKAITNRIGRPDVMARARMR